MFKVDIYLAQSTASLSKDERWHGYVVACIKNGEEKTVNGFGHIFGTYHEATLRSLSDALDRLKRRSAGSVDRYMPGDFKGRIAG